MLTNILVPLDGSPASEVALPYAEALAQRAHARLTLVRAVHVPLLHTDQGHAECELIDQAETYLSQIAERVSLRGLTVETGVPYGDAAGWIIEEVALRQVDAIVMSTHDRGGPNRWMHGSIAESVVRHARVPVVVVRAEDGVCVAGAIADVQRAIVVPLDGSTLAEAALSDAANLARTLSGRLVLVGVVPEASDPVVGAAGLGTYVGDRDAQLVLQMEDYLGSTKQRLIDDGHEVATVLARGDAASEIAHVARQVAAALVVMTTHGRTGVARAVVGSVAGEVVHACACPVMLIRPAHLLTHLAQQNGAPDVINNRCSA